MEVAAPGLKKDMVKMNIDKDGYLNVSIEQKADKKEEKKDDVKKIEVKSAFSSENQTASIKSRNSN